MPLLFIGYCPNMQMQWKILQPDPELVTQIQGYLKCHPITAQVLANRQIHSNREIDLFIQAGLDNLPSPNSLSGIDSAVGRIVQALERNENILIFGDYDADGVTAAAVLYNFLKAAGANVTYHLPHRVKEGYGLLPIHVMQLALPRHINLIITVDNGSSSFEAVAAAKRFSIDVIVTDHHNIDGGLPAAHTVINPKLEKKGHSLEELAGVGVAFYLVIALRTALRNKGWWKNRPEPNLKNFCDLVAIGTVADMVALKGVNRLLTQIGLQELSHTPRPGIRALLMTCGIHHNAINAEDIAYRLAPRLNAAGRLAHADIAFKLINDPQFESALKSAEELDALNQRRRAIEMAIFQEIVENLDCRKDLLSQSSLFLAGTDWHEGVLGVVAAKLVERYHKPVVIVSADRDKAKGSGRSIPQVDLYAALEKCAHLLDTFGGHRMAAGLSVKTKNIGKLKSAFEDSVQSLIHTNEMTPHLAIDCEIDLDQIEPRLLDELEQLAPYGVSNPQPLFMARDIRVTQANIVGQHHRRMQLSQPHQSRPPVTAIQFNIPEDGPRPRAFERLAFKLQWNRYKGEKTMQMIVENW